MAEKTTYRASLVYLLLVYVLHVDVLLALSTENSARPPKKFVILGGTGRIGTAVASHLLFREPDSKIVLVGRSHTKGTKAVEEVLSERPGAAVTWQYLNNVWSDSKKDLCRIISNADCLIHTAGPYLGEQPLPLQAAIQCGVPAYVDVSDPLDFLEESLSLSESAEQSSTSALLAAGAFPGMSNVLAVEAASKLQGEGIKDIRFNYFTAGLGGSGDVNLFITNLGFGEPMVQYDRGKLRSFQALSGMLLGKIDFFLDNDGEGFGNRVAKERVGSQTVFAWPFPEAATVAKELGPSGDSSAAMGTAPDIWNSMLGVLVSVVPRRLWKSRRFSKFLADFSQPLVKMTDTLLRFQSPDDVGETHAMRVDVTSEEGKLVSIVQGHESFRRCVGQSCAEFSLDLLEFPASGVQLPEQRYCEDDARRRIIDKLTATPGTFCFTGPVLKLSSGARSPTDIDEAIRIANERERNLTS
jgi:NAD(P)-dependent dehydrogenase (short-subunit alcohol dehydrogenase family)